MKWPARLFPLGKISERGLITLGCKSCTDEIYAALRKTKLGAAGLDKISRDDIRKLDPRALLVHFNLWLYVGYQPAGYRRSRTVLIPKVPLPSETGQFRPIAISSYVSKVFHRLLAGRLSGLLQFNSRQRAFVKGDGIADNVFLLRHLPRDICDALEPLSMAFLDVSKAFDSVSHASLSCWLRREWGCLYLLFMQPLYRGINSPTGREPVEQPLGAEPRGQAR